MMRDPIEDLHKVSSENMCDVCTIVKAQWYSMTFYIHVCAIDCYEDFLNKYDDEIEIIARKRLEPGE